jgi:ankyrin repeat protein
MSTNKLIDCKCVDDKDDVYTLLTEAVYSSDVTIVRLLIEGGVDVNQMSCKLHGYSPLQVAKNFGHRGMIKLLLDNGAKT